MRAQLDLALRSLDFTPCESFQLAYTGIHQLLQLLFAVFIGLACAKTWGTEQITSNYYQPPKAES